METWILFSDSLPAENLPIAFEDDVENLYEGYMHSDKLYVAIQGPDEEFIGTALRWRQL